jgi:hypothetical protein
VSHPYVDAFLENVALLIANVQARDEHARNGLDLMKAGRMKEARLELKLAEKYERRLGGNARRPARS